MNQVFLNISQTKTIIIIYSLLLIFSFGCSSEDNSSSTTSIYTGLASWGIKAQADVSGDILVTGFAYGDVSTDSGSGEADIFIAKHDNATGNRTLFQQPEGSGEDFVQAIVVDAAKNTYVAGYTNGELVSGQAQGGTDIFVMKYNSAGIKQWEKQYGSSENDYCWGITTDGTNFYLVGNTEGVFPGTGATNAHGSDILLLKLNANGDQTASIQIGNDTAINTNVYSQSYGTTITYDGISIIIGGITNDTLGESNIGSNDIIIAKYTTSLAQTWIRQLGTAYADSITEIAVDASDDIYFTGFSYGTPYPDYDYTDEGYSEDHTYTEVFLYNYNSAGIFDWVAQAGTSSYDRGYSLAVDGTDIYVTGNTLGSLYGTNAGSYDFFILNYDTAGTLLWKRQFGSTVYDTASGITVDSSGDIIITGKTYGTLNSKSNDSAAFSAFISKHDDVSGDYMWTEVY